MSLIEYKFYISDLKYNRSRKYDFLLYDRHCLGGAKDDLSIKLDLKTTRKVIITIRISSLVLFASSSTSFSCIQQMRWL